MYSPPPPTVAHQPRACCIRLVQIIVVVCFFLLSWFIYLDGLKVYGLLLRSVIPYSLNLFYVSESVFHEEPPSNVLLVANLIKNIKKLHLSKVFPTALAIRILRG